MLNRKYRITITDEDGTVIETVEVLMVSETRNSPMSAMEARHLVKNGLDASMTFADAEDIEKQSN